MDELCRDLVKPIVEGPDPESESEVIDLTVNDKRSSTENPDTSAPVLPPPQVPPIQDQATSDPQTETVGVRVKTEDTPLASGTVFANTETADRDNVNLLTSSIPNSLSSDITPKVEEFSQPGPSCLPPRPWEHVVVARNEEHAPIEDLLDCLSVEELQSLVKSLKVKCASKKVS